MGPFELMARTTDISTTQRVFRETVVSTRASVVRPAVLFRSAR